MKLLLKLLLLSILCLDQTVLWSQAIEDPDTKSEQFNFWIGEWDVNLRVRQSDTTWKDTYQAIARIYPILKGKAILELWEEQGREGGIIGYSLRYYDSSIDKWVLWLNWPGKERSGTTTLAGNFRNERGEFFSTRATSDTTSLISRYTFSDVTDNSLRWDDAYSKDGGETWSHNWIMEFSRKNNKAPKLVPGLRNHTNSRLDRCTLGAFDLIKELAEYGQLKGKEGIIEWYGVLEGCSVISLLQTKEQEEISVLTYNTYAQVYEELVLGSESTSAEIYYGKLIGDTIELRNQEKTKRRRLTLDNSSFRLEKYEGDVQSYEVTFEFEN